MVFASLEFLTLFLPVFFALYFITPRAYRNYTMLLGSWLFYAWWTPKFLLLIIFLTVVTWLAAILIERTTSEKLKTRLMAGAIIINLASLAWYKYANVVFRSLNDLFGSPDHPLIVWETVFLPIALSFTVLHATSYLVDVRRKVVPAQYSFNFFAAYIAMFPHLIAGPIVRYKVIEKELRERYFSLDEFATGVRCFMIGFSMKVLIADPLSPLVALVFKQSSPSLVDAWIGCGAYTIQLYFDFAGYSLMAIGLGLMMGFKFEPNFNNPYLSVSIQDFWRRWHMTLSSWLRDYLYISLLGGNRGGRVRTYINMLLTMSIGGLWHGGESWNFLIWGVIHGSALSIARAYNNMGYSMPDFFSRLLTLVVVMLAWTIFRAADFSAALHVWGGQFGLNGIAMGDEVALAMRPTLYASFIIGIICIGYPATRFAKQEWGLFSHSVWRAVWPTLAFAYALVVLTGQQSPPFLYFQF
ncbi:MAG: membrane-bound O-acyltransferase family protein [Gallionellaceae bacterium CG1_02_56_997]|nr:MAG: membrane-bound O-acyltransferase family protein [Gallionellaceae bacterium CG1_02_56_997]HCJ50660.1 MBOAT family protein [Gallionella sp.]